jgi:hypothetical protein
MAKWPKKPKFVKPPNFPEINANCQKAQNWPKQKSNFAKRPNLLALENH